MIRNLPVVLPRIEELEILTIDTSTYLPARLRPGLGNSKGDHGGVVRVKEGHEQLGGKGDVVRRAQRVPISASKIYSSNAVMN
jgi:hypothetical protein